jgi:hypothetical protein
MLVLGITERGGSRGYRWRALLKVWCGLDGGRMLVRGGLLLDVVLAALRPPCLFVLQSARRHLKEDEWTFEDETHDSLWPTGRSTHRELAAHRI